MSKKRIPNHGLKTGRQIRTDRRRFLRNVGAFGALGAAASVFPWLAGQKAKAQGGVKPRLVVFYTPHGTVRDRWLPSGTRTDFTLPQILQPLEPHREHVTVLDGLDLGMTPGVRNMRVPHTFDMVSLLTGSDINTSDSDFMREHFGGTYFGWNLTESVDQAIANRLPAMATPYRSIEFGINCGNAHPNSRMSYSGPRVPKHPFNNPLQAYEQIFSDAFEPDRDVATLRRQSVLDAVREDLGVVSRRLGSVDRARLDRHAAAIRSIEDSLVASYSCTAPPSPPNMDRQFQVDQQLDLLVASLACDMTQVATFQHTRADNDNSLYPWAGLNSGGHHTFSHDESPAALTTLAGVYTWYAQRFAHLLERLSNTDDADGTKLIDNTTVLWVTEIARGRHSIDDIPVIVAGGGMGRHTGNRFLQTSGQTNRLLVSAFHAMGFDDVDTFGLADVGSGGVDGLLSV